MEVRIGGSLAARLGGTYDCVPLCRPHDIVRRIYQFHLGMEFGLPVAGTNLPGYRTGGRCME